MEFKMSILGTICYSVVFINYITMSTIQAVPLTPCPRVFHYEYNDRNWVGVASVLASVYNQFRESEMTLSIRFRMPFHFLLNNKCSIALSCPNQDCLKSVISKNQPIKYTVMFSQQVIIPSIVRIMVNQMNICEDIPNENENLNPIHQFQLRHTVFISSKRYNPSVITGYSMDASSAQEQPFSLLQKLGHNQNDKSCGHFEISNVPAIKNNESVPPGFWPWLVAIYKKRLYELQFQCSGSLISTKLVLTAAHCLWLHEPRQPTNTLVAIGRYNLRDWTEAATKLLDASSFYFHPNYMQGGNRFEADLAIIRLSKSIAYNRLMRPICLPPRQGLQLPKIGTFVGWRHEDKQMINVPQLMNMQMITRQECVARNSSFQYISSNRSFCAVYGVERGPCDKDAGGGLANWSDGRWFITGIFSVALADPVHNTCDQYASVVFTDVSKFVDWLEQVRSTVH